ncbi:adenylate/guanylate cyclase domain-containing protein [Nocardioides bizhenqiangii]|uniref:Adenylate/guanylate cyclase domain-containing protein n=1 Tax=Nocardioides bizhenqiangii TaxID=3095076 RepID=A0ABZ0ZPS6_9ACTN|nr:adenylate/guanylate cyclase domain-containing protein [Nocardioides sp. HM61]WQQ26320.1 adenylate/guanylate cyclase domain-containing protein [Nocardioides sp. HM61]
MPRPTPVSKRSPFGARILGPREQEPRRLRIRIQLLLTLVLVSTNVLGAGVVFVVNNFAVPAPEPNDAMLVALAIGVPAYVVTAAIVGVIWGTATSLRALRWATLGTDVVPTEKERRQALNVPLQLTMMQLALWLAGSCVFTVLAIVLQPERALATGLTVGIGALVVAGISYLLTEFTLRPVAARALADTEVNQKARFVGVGPRMVIFWAIGTAVPVVGLMIAAILAIVDEGETTLRQLAVVTLVVCTAVLTFGFVLTDLNARSVVAPIMSVREALRSVEEGDLDVDVVVYDGTELGALQSGFNQMVGGLREKEKLRDLFGRHVGHEVAAAAAAVETGEVELGGESRVASVLFVDLVGSTAYASDHDAAEVVAVLNRFFGVVVDEVDRRGGLVNKFIGDAVLAIFGAPVPDEDHAASALAAAREMAIRLEEELPEIGAGIGVATGTVVAGNVGSESRYEYTVIGDAVNSASRLTELAKDVPGGVLATWDTVVAAVERGDADAAAQWQKCGAKVLRGRTEKTALATPVWD